MADFSLHDGGKRKYLTPDERLRFIDATASLRNGRARSFCLVLAHTGGRITEVLSLTNRDAMRNKGQICLGKGRNYREVPVPPELSRYLGLYHTYWSPWDGILEPMWSDCSRTTAWRWVTEVMAVAGLSGAAATPKGLRHGFAIAALEKGVPPKVVQNWLGHTDIRMVAIYAEEVRFSEDMQQTSQWERSPRLQDEMQQYDK